MWIFSYPSVLTYVFGAQKDCLTETLLLSTNNICFGWEKFVTKVLLVHMLSTESAQHYKCLMVTCGLQVHTMFTQDFSFSFDSSVASTEANVCILQCRFTIHSLSKRTLVVILSNV